MYIYFRIPLVIQQFSMKQGPFKDYGPMLERRGQPSVERRGKVSKQNRYEPVPCWDAIVDRWFILTDLKYFIMYVYIYIHVYMYVCNIYIFNGDWTIESSKEVWLENFRVTDDGYG